MKILQVSAEIFPLLKTGGLADVCGALPEALKRHGCDVRVLLPGFPAIRRGVANARPIALMPTLPHGGRVLRGTLPSGVVAYVIDAPSLYDREGNPYTDRDGAPYADNHRRFALLGLTAARLAEAGDDPWRPDIVHAHDWHAGLAPAYLHASGRALGKLPTPSVYTVHNLAFQGNFASTVFGELGLPPDYYQLEGLEFHHQVSFMKAGLRYADLINTVSPTYALEIQSEEQGCGLDGVLRARSDDLVGILNGVDDEVWNPMRDPHLAERYGPSRMAGKRTCRTALQAELGLTKQDDAPIFGVVSRLAEQKGISLVLAGLSQLLGRGAQLVVLGSGDAALAVALRDAMAAHAGSVAARLGFDEALAHRIIAGADVIMMPSRFEPGGLTQLYGLKYGTLPLVRRVGGLADTVVDCSLENLVDGIATGFVFERFDLRDYDAALRRAFTLFRRQDEWMRVQKQAMTQDFGWDPSAAKYAEVYRRALASSV
jgi:starch synthase